MRGTAKFPRTRDFGYWVVIDGKFARNGRVRVAVNNKGQRRIWQEEDDFVNVCINESKRLWKIGGRLDCFTDAGYLYSIKLLS